MSLKDDHSNSLKYFSPETLLKLEQASGLLTPHPVGLHSALSNKMNVNDLCWTGAEREGAGEKRWGYYTMAPYKIWSSFIFLNQIWKRILPNSVVYWITMVQEVS